MIDPQSKEGRELLAWLAEEERKKMRTLAKPTHDFPKTQYLRGEIKILRMVTQYIQGDADPNEPSS